MNNIDRTEKIQFTIVKVVLEFLDLKLTIKKEYTRYAVLPELLIVLHTHFPAPVFLRPALKIS